MARATLALCLAISLLGLHMRLTAVQHTEVIQPIRADAVDYFLYAFNLKTAGVYSSSDSAARGMGPPSADAKRPPGFPILASWVIDPDSVQRSVANVSYLNAAMGALIAPLFFYLALPLVGLPGACGVALLVALSPHLVNSSVYFLTEAASAFTLALFVSGFVLLTRFKSWVLALLVGLLLGYSALTRSFLVFFWPILGIFMLYHRRHFDRRLVVALLAGAVVVQGGWSLRNALVVEGDTGAVLLKNSLLHGAYPDFLYQGRPETYGFPYHFDPEIDQASQSVRTALTTVLARVSERPAEMLSWYLFGKPRTLWSWSIISGQGDAFIYPVKDSPYGKSALFQLSHGLMRSLHGALVSLAVLGCVLAWSTGIRRALGLAESEMIPVQLISLLLVYATVVHMVVAPFPRYSIPLRPELYMMAAFGVSALLRLYRRATDGVES